MKEPVAPCWYHRFGAGTPCPREGRYYWREVPEVPGRAVLLAMRWCDEHRHPSDVLAPAPGEEPRR